MHIGCVDREDLAGLGVDVRRVRLAIVQVTVWKERGVGIVVGMVDLRSDWCGA